MAERSKPPRPAPPKLPPNKSKQKTSFDSISIHFDHKDEDDKDSFNETIQFRKSQSDHGFSTMSSGAKPLPKKELVKEPQELVKDPQELVKDPLLHKTPSSSRESSPERPPKPKRAPPKIPRRNTPVEEVVIAKSPTVLVSEIKPEYNSVRGFVKAQESVLVDSESESVLSGDSYKDDDPLTIMSKQWSEDDRYHDNLTEPKEPVGDTNKNTLGVVTSGKSRASSFKLVDDYYEPVDDLDGSIAAKLSQKSSAGVDHSKAVAVGSASATKRGLVRRLRKPKPKEKGTPIAYSSLSDDKSEEEEYETDQADIPASDNQSELGTSDVSAESTDPPTHSEIVQLPAMPFKELGFTTIFVFTYLIVPLPSYISGLITGVILTFLCMKFHSWFTKPRKTHEPVELPDLNDLPPLYVPEMKESKNDPGIFKGWMNELGHKYDPEDYHINQTHSIFIRLEGTHLRLSQPKVNIPKRAMWNEETIHNPKYIAQRHLDLTGSKVFLLPGDLVKKRVWSKKYPVCIAVKEAIKHEALNKKIAANPSPPTQNDSDDENGAKSNYSATDAGFEVIDEAAVGSVVHYFFARTGREKEQWFRRFQAAGRGFPLCTNVPELRRLAGFKSIIRNESNSSLKKHRRQNSTDSMSSISSMGDQEAGQEPDMDESESASKSMLVDYMRYMGQIMPQDSPSKFSTISSTLRKETLLVGRHVDCESNIVWANALIGRIMWDFLREKYWSNKMMEKVQKKLEKIHVPYFIDALTISALDLGASIPAIRRSSKPYIDESGLWIDCDIAYAGGLKMVLETKVNLMKLKKTNSKEMKEGKHFQTDPKSPITDSDEEDSAESSSDDETENIEAAEEPLSVAPTTSTQMGAGRKILKFLDKITDTKYFQKATEYKYIKKAMESVSNTTLTLTVEVKSLVGCLAVNIPPPPTDRVWYGFRTNPKLSLSATPRVGERQVNYQYITEWIEKKLTVEFQKVFVLPNMDDIVLPIMVSKIQEPEMTNTK